MKQIPETANTKIGDTSEKTNESCALLKGGHFKKERRAGDRFPSSIFSGVHSLVLLGVGS